MLAKHWTTCSIGKNKTKRKFRLRNDFAPFVILTERNHSNLSWTVSCGLLMSKLNQMKKLTDFLSVDFHPQNRKSEWFKFICWKRKICATFSIDENHNRKHICANRVRMRSMFMMQTLNRRWQSSAEPFTMLRLCATTERNSRLAVGKNKLTKASQTHKFTIESLV